MRFFYVQNFLGSFIKLKDPSWIPAVENQLGFGTLTSFYVDNGQDGRVLDIIIKEVFGHERPPQVVISKFFDRVSIHILKNFPATAGERKLSLPL